MTNSPDLDCIVAGDANVDLLLDGVIRLEAGKEKLASRMEMMLGGSSTIMAHNLARMGSRVGFAGIVGRDAFGKFVQEKLKNAGIDLAALKVDRQEKSGLTVWHSKLGQRAAVTYLGTNAKLNAAQISRTLHRARHLHVGGYFLLDGLHAGAAALFKKARRGGMTTSLDCNYDPTEEWDSNIRAVLRDTDIFFPNETEALRITRTKTPLRAAHVLSQDVRIVAIKMGERGVLMSAEGSTWAVPALPSRVVDTTGAGDSFTAGFLSNFLAGADVKQCAQAGVAAAARTISVVGGTTAFEKRR